MASLSLWLTQTHRPLIQNEAQPNPTLLSYLDNKYKYNIYTKQILYTQAHKRRREQTDIWVHVQDPEPNVETFGQNTHMHTEKRA